MKHWLHNNRNTQPSDTLTSLHLRHSSFSNHSAALPTSQLILQPFRCFTYVVGTSPTSQLILQPFRRFTNVIGTSPTSAHSTTFPPLYQRHRHFTYVTFHSLTLPPLHLRHSSFYNPSAASPYVTGNSTTLPLLHIRHRHFTYFTWRAAHT